MCSHEHSEEELRELLPGLEFLQATRELRRIQEITEEKQMYDSREKGYLDWQSSMLDAREEGAAGWRWGVRRAVKRGWKREFCWGVYLLFRRFLGEQLATEEEIKQWPISRLSEAIVTVQAKLRDRKS